MIFKKLVAYFVDKLFKKVCIPKKKIKNSDPQSHSLSFSLPELPDGYEYCSDELQKFISLGMGSQGAVYLVLDKKNKRFAAAKVLTGENSTAYSRFTDEIKTLVGLHEHPNIVKIYEYQIKDKPWYFIMEYLEEGSLAERIEKRDLSLQDKLLVLYQVAIAVDFMHENKYIHRDLNPKNILFDSAANPKITDFGVTKVPKSNITEAGYIVGTPCYMAPEQWGGKTEPRSDIWALGMILYKMLTNQLPFGENREILSIGLDICNKDIPDPHTLKDLSSLEKEAESICIRALKKDLKDRYQSAKEMADALQKLLNKIALSSKVSNKPNKPNEAVIIQNFAQLLENGKESLLARVKQFYECNHICVDCQCPITFEMITDSQAFYSFKRGDNGIEKQYLCVSCFAKRKPLYNDYRVIEIDLSSTPKIYLAWKNNATILRKFANDKLKALARIQRAQQRLQELNTSHLLKLKGFDKLITNNSIQYYMLEQYIPGVYLHCLKQKFSQEEINNRGQKYKKYLPFTYEETIYLLSQMIEALQELHQQFLIHRAITPFAILIGCNGLGYLGNFELTKFKLPSYLSTPDPDMARETTDNTTLGYLHYMAPEQIKDAVNATNQSDIWALGVIGYELITGNYPFADQQEVLYKTPQFSGNFLNLKPIITKCLQKEPEFRYTNVEEMKVALREDFC